MKKRIALLSYTLFATFLIANAQSGFGIKGGLSYNSNGELNQVSDIYKNDGKGKSGFNIGLYGKLDLGPIYLRPELVYTKTTSEYVLNSENVNYKISKIDVPVLVGFKLFGPIDIFAGPAFQYYLDNDLKGLNFESIDNEFSLGMNIGASIELGRIGVDVRYERGLSKNESNWTNASETFTLDSRPEQLIFSVSYRLSKKKE
ncbi:MAG: outer membrane beta-barrel protein [Lutibacter sp.]|uniref:outer membrane beta-barrel protein n=1 Tax=Lutibacter sp. TaxID=1925666 RepID=UPI0019ECB3F2|nr:outer membrane beta-barrel protein [Lutibacter sp.]NOR29127.1 outer membrane beta-barrel protein [Lutibacter sp.]